MKISVALILAQLSFWAITFGEFHEKLETSKKFYIDQKIQGAYNFVFNKIKSLNYNLCKSH